MAGIGMKETRRHIKAFEFFYALGGEPTAENGRRTAEISQIHERTFWKWYAEFNWKERVRRANTEAHALAMEELTKQAAERKKEHIEVLQDIQKEFRTEMDYLRAPFAYAKADMEDGNIRIKNTKDMSELARGRQGYAKSIMDAQKQEMVEMGEPMERLEHSGEVKGDFTFRIVGVDPDSFPEQDDE